MKQMAILINTLYTYHENAHNIRKAIAVVQPP